MVERLGNVLYWLGCGFAALSLVLGAVVAVAESPVALIAGGVFAIGAWLLGRAARYVLAGT